MKSFIKITIQRPNPLLHLQTAEQSDDLLKDNCYLHMQVFILVDLSKSLREVDSLIEQQFKNSHKIVYDFEECCYVNRSQIRLQNSYNGQIANPYTPLLQVFPNFTVLNQIVLEIYPKKMKVGWQIYDIGNDNVKRVLHIDSPQEFTEVKTNRTVAQLYIQRGIHHYLLKGYFHVNIQYYSYNNKLINIETYNPEQQQIKRYANTTSRGEIWKMFIMRSLQIPIYELDIDVYQPLILNLTLKKSGSVYEYFEKFIIGAKKSLKCTADYLNPCWLKTCEEVERKYEIIMNSNDDSCSIDKVKKQFDRTVRQFKLEPVVKIIELMKADQDQQEVEAQDQSMHSLQQEDEWERDEWEREEGMGNQQKQSVNNDDSS